jgi:hypothetical protein
MRVDMGPVAPAAATAWIEWANLSLAVHGPDRGSYRSLGGLLDDEVGRYLERCTPPVGAGNTRRWQVDIDPDELEYLLHGVFRLEARLADEVRRGERTGPPAEGWDFFLVLVRDLLRALEAESPGRAAFADQLRSSWPTAAASN